MLKIGSRSLAQTPLFTLSGSRPKSSFDWRVKLLYKDGGPKKDWFIGQQDNPINRINFEINKRLMGAGSIEFANVDFPLDGGDFLQVYFKEDKIYQAKVESTVDPKGGKAKLIPFHVRFQHLIVAYDFTGQTVEQMLQTIIEGTQADTGISWNPFFINTGSVETFDRDYSGGESPAKIITELIGLLDDREWGANEDNIFQVYLPDQTVTKNLFYTYKPAYSKITVKKEWSKVKATRYFVNKKASGGGESEPIGTVGYGGLYPILGIESILGESRVKKFNVSEVIIDDADALQVAYDDLVAQAIVPEIINVSDVDLDRYIPTIGQRIKVQDKREFILRTIVNGNQLAEDDTTMKQKGKWNNVSVDTTNFVTNAASIKATLQNNLDFFSYDFEDVIRFFNPIKIGFMVRATQTGDFLEWSSGSNIAGGWSSGAWSSGAYSSGTSTSDSLWETTKNVSIANSNIWFYKEFNVISSDMRYIAFRLNQTLTSSVDVNIDRIDLYLPHAEVYENNVVQASFTIRRGGYNADMKLNQYDIFANDADFANERSIEKIENILQGV